MRIRQLGAVVSAACLAAGGAAAQSSPVSIAPSIAARRPMPATRTRTPLVLRSDVPGPGDAGAPDPSSIDAFDSVVDGVNANGVARLSVFVTPTAGVSCTGALVAPTVMLTAAHCVTDDRTGSLVTARDMVRARFIGPASRATDIWSSRVVVRPEWQGLSNPLTNAGYDVALVFLAEPAAPWMTRYDLFAGDPYAPWFQDVAFVGYGAYGNGFLGAQGFDRGRRWGRNRVDYVADAFLDASDPGVLWTDFDNGSARNDAWCWATGAGDGNPFCDTGRGPAEFGLGAGDSGGPLFVGGQLAGVASFLTTFCGDAECRGPAVPPLYDAAAPDGWGSLNGFASVAYNADWIRQEIAANAPAAVATPEPSVLLLTAGGLLVGVGAARRRRVGSRGALA